jgi:LIM domain
VCGTVLSGEYMGKDGQPYCEKDYQKSFGVKCAYCERYISGKVLQAGDNHHFHPTCARCSKCGDPFGDGEEMYLQGTAIWHPRCGPGPSENGATLINGGTSGDIDRISNSAMSEIQVSYLAPATPAKHTQFTFMVYFYPESDSSSFLTTFFLLLLLCIHFTSRFFSFHLFFTFFFLFIVFSCSTRHSFHYVHALLVLMAPFVVRIRVEKWVLLFFIFCCTILLVLIRFSLGVDAFFA